MLLAPTIAYDQYIDVDPVYPTVNDSVDVTFHVNRSESNWSILGYSGDIYAHTGVLTDESVDDGDWKFVIAGWTVNLPKAKLEKLDDTTYVLHIVPDIYSYYAISEGPNVEQLAFVFRSPDGSKQTQNIYYDVYEAGLSVVITEPEKDLVVETDSVIPVSAQAIVLGTSEPDSLTLYVDGSADSVYYTSSLNYEYTASGPGQHWIKVVAANAEYSVADSVSVFVRDEITIAELPAGVRDGVNIVNDTSVTFVVYAPHKGSILVIGDFNNWQLSNDYLFNQTPDNDRFWLEVTHLNAEEEYAFQYLIDGSIRVADPYTEKILDGANDPYIPSTTYPDLRPYPSGKTTGIVSVFQTVQDEYEWQTSSFEVPSRTDLVIYELHVQNYTEEGTIKALTDTLDYISHLGTNAIELMPVNEFEGNLSWGYNPSFYFAFDKIYGTKNDFKAFVDACHSRGMAVIIDMVLNHSYRQSPLLEMYWDEEANKPAADNPWYNTDHNFVDNTSAHWGYDFNHESPATQALVDSINSYWMSEYHIDGFRFDFTKGFSNTLWYGANNWASDYDADRIAILERMSDEIWARNPDACVIFEHLAVNSEETELADHGIMLWGNMNYEYNEATMGYTSNFQWGAYTNRGWSEPHLVSYMESHDEERLMYKNQRWGASNDSYDVTDEHTALRRMEAAAAFFFTVPGPKMMFQWGELGYDYSINTCSDGSVDDNGGCRLALKPVGWEFYPDLYHYRLMKVFEALIKLKINEDLFETTSFTMSTSSSMKKIHLNSASMNATILGNFGLIENSIVPAFQHTGTWYDYFTGEPLEVSDVDAEINLGPGRFRLYTDLQLDMPDVPELPDFIGNSLIKDQNISFFPNPTSGIVYLITEETTPVRFELYSANGNKLLCEDRVAEASTPLEIEINDSQGKTMNGLYIYRLITPDYMRQGKLILEK